MKIFTLLAIAVAMSSNISLAQEQSSLTTGQITQKIQQKVQLFADAVTCWKTEAPDQKKYSVSPKMIAALSPYIKNDNEVSGEFVAFWVGDMGCNGGSGTTSYYLATVRVDLRGDFYVDPLASEPFIKISDQLNTRFIEKIAGNTNNTIIVDALNYGSDDDGNNFPSHKYRYTLKLDSKNNWNLLEKKFLGVVKQ